MGQFTWAFILCNAIHYCTTGLLVISYVFMGTMPPSLTMGFGFWLLLYTNYLASYCNHLIIVTFRQNIDKQWMNVLIRVGLTVSIIGFALGAILFLIPITAETMLSSSKAYYKVYGRIPPFLERFQIRFQCCGINNYLDYGLRDFTNFGYGTKGFYVHRSATEKDSFFHDLVSDVSINRTIARKTTGLDVPKSCCRHPYAILEGHEDCGKQIEYTNATGGELLRNQEESARNKVNDPKMGCYEKYNNNLEVGSRIQVNYLLTMIQLVPIFQCAMTCGIYWLHKIGMAKVKELNYWLPAFQQLQEMAENPQIEPEAPVPGREPDEDDEKEFEIKSSKSRHGHRHHHGHKVHKSKSAGNAAENNVETDVPK